MPLPLRITFNGADHSYAIVSKFPLLKGIDELELLVDGHPATLLRTENGWVPKDEDPEGLLTAIAKILSGRYLV